jgi:hypothetical protein
MDELLYYRPYSTELLKSHRRTLLEAKLTRDALLNEKERTMREKLNGSLAPVDGLLPPGPRLMLEGVGWASALDKVIREPTKRNGLGVDLRAQSQTPEETPAAQSPRAPWMPDWRQITVSFVAGAVVATLLSMQLRELRRRRQETAETATRG